MTLLQRINADYKKHLEEHWTEDGRQRTLEMQMCEPTFDVIQGADGIKRPHPRAISDIYRKHVGLDFGRVENTKEICGND